MKGKCSKGESKEGVKKKGEKVSLEIGERNRDEKEASVEVLELMSVCVSECGGVKRTFLFMFFDMVPKKIKSCLDIDAEN